MEGHGRSWKVKEGQGRSRKVKEGHGWSFPITGLIFQGRKVLGGVGVVGWWPVGLYCQPQSQSLSSGLWIRDLRLGFGTGLGLDNIVIQYLLGWNILVETLMCNYALKSRHLKWTCYSFRSLGALAAQCSGS